MFMTNDNCNDEFAFDLYHGYLRLLRKMKKRLVSEMGKEKWDEYLDTALELLPGIMGNFAWAYIPDTKEGQKQIIETIIDEKLYWWTDEDQPNDESFGQNDPDLWKNELPCLRFCENCGMVFLPANKQQSCCKTCRIGKDDIHSWIFQQDE